MEGEILNAITHVNYEKNTQEFEKTWIRKCH